MGDTAALKDDRELLRHLIELGCCKLCCLRYLGVHTPSVYQHPTDFLQSRNLQDCVQENEVPNKVKKSNACVACLGLLQEHLLETIINKIISDVNAAEYDCKEFSCALSMPISFSLRTHSLNLHVLRKIPSISYSSAEASFVSVKDVWKWVTSHRISEGIGKDFNSKDSDFSITVNIEYEDDDEECRALLDMHKKTFDVRKTQTRKFKDGMLSRKSVEALLLTTEEDHFCKYYPSPPEVPNTPIKCSSVSLLHNSLFIAGRYNKYSRKLCQTPWIINGERTMESSVQELICNPILKVIKAQDLKFASSGREDVDVRMLGNGRPFVCELINPHRVHLEPQEFRAIERNISSSTKEVSVRHLQKVSKDQVAQVKAGEEDKVKTYNAYCIVLGENAFVDWDKLASLPSKCPIILKQRTPIRVLHRRSLATRERSIFRMEICKAETDEPKAFVLKMATQAGTYVKEFVHGDFGRTSPSLRDLLGTEVDILALDVLDIELDWPPPVEYHTNQESEMS